MSSISRWLDRVTKIARILESTMKAKKAIPRTTKLIDTWLLEDEPVVDFVRQAIEAGISKTPAYFYHTGFMSKVPKKYLGLLEVMNPKDRKRKQDFLALYDILKEEEDEEKETVQVWCFRDACTVGGMIYKGVNLYFIGFPSALEEIENEMEALQAIFADEIEQWADWEYERSAISICDFDDIEEADVDIDWKTGFVFEVSDDIGDGTMQYWGTWHTGKWIGKRKMWEGFPWQAVERQLKKAGL